jgi:hypothetical protein
MARKHTLLAAAVVAVAWADNHKRVVWAVTVADNLPVLVGQAVPALLSIPVAVG